MDDFHPNNFKVARDYVFFIENRGLTFWLKRPNPAPLWHYNLPQEQAIKLVQHLYCRKSYFQLIGSKENAIWTSLPDKYFEILVIFRYFAYLRPNLQGLPSSQRVSKTAILWRTIFSVQCWIIWSISSIFALYCLRKTLARRREIL